MYNRIVAYGCSITSGFELADYELMPSLNFVEINKIKAKGVEFWRDKIESKYSLEYIDSREHNHAWPQHLANKLNVDVVNRAYPGSNSESSIYFLEEDISRGFIKPTDLIIVAHTESSRWFYLDKECKKHHCCPGGLPKEWNSQLSHRLRWPSKSFHKDYVLHVSNDFNDMFRWFKDIKYLEMLSKKHNILQVFAFTPFLTQLHNNINKFKEYNLLNAYNSVKEFNSILDNYFSFNDLVNWDDSSQLHTYTHPKEEYHIEYANYIYKKIKDRQ
jgi:hypothetical protein